MAYLIAGAIGLFAFACVALVIRLGSSGSFRARVDKRQREMKRFLESWGVRQRSGGGSPSLGRTGRR